MSVELPQVFGHNGQMSADGVAMWKFGPYQVVVHRTPQTVGLRAWTWGISFTNAALLKGTAPTFQEAVVAVERSAIEQLRIWSDIVRPSARPRVFVSSPFRADSMEGMAENIDRARIACQDVEAAGGAPFAPHLLFPQFLPEDSAWRESTRAWLAAANSMHIVGPITPGMQEEIGWANEFRVPLTGDVPSQ